MKIKKEQDRRKKSGDPAYQPTRKELETRNPPAADANNNPDKNHQNENHEDRIFRHKSNNGIKPRKNRGKNGGNVRNQCGKGTSSSRQYSSFLIRLFMVNEL